MPRQKTTQTRKTGDNADAQAVWRSTFGAEPTEAEKPAARELLMFQKMVRGLDGETRAEFRDALLNVLIHTPDEAAAVTILKTGRENKDKGGLRDFLALVPPAGRRKGHTGDFWLEALAYFWAYKVCKLSQKETLFYFGKIDSLDGNLTRNQRRDFKNRVEAARQHFEEGLPAFRPFEPFVLALHPMSKEERKAWAIKLLLSCRERLCQSITAPTNQPLSK